MTLDTLHNLRVFRDRLASRLMSECEPMQPSVAFAWSADFARGSIPGAQLIDMDDPGIHQIVPIRPTGKIQEREVFKPHDGLGAREIFSFWFNGSTFEIDAQSHPRYSVMLWVDGRRAADQVIEERQASGGNVRRQLRVDFGSRRLRRIVVMTGGFGGTAGILLNPSADTLMPYTPGLSSPLVALSDSYGGFGQWGFPHGGAAILLADAAGCHFANLQHGGSGYQASNEGLNFLERLERFQEQATAWPPSVLVVSGGINDQDDAGTQTEIQRFFAYCAEYLRSTLLIVHGPWCPNQSYLTGKDRYNNIHRQITKSLARLRQPWWIYLNTLEGGWVTGWGASARGNGPWITGTGREGSRRGDGNADFYIREDGTHPTSEGHPNGVAYLARRTRTEVLKALKTAPIS